ncbi:hypothetical protein Pyn_38738 [Prunus yedoensis var. nudiflora]|uniref:Uncharacterized protein n=1 Tax=Prunus yedoensis var. nudiflora TaxID=2094558 RepID=A0A314UVT6_PRUYE|nr:hypothetical protein Pyn_38738 [Prunus yedoensis var. nudiflora]
MTQPLLPYPPPAPSSVSAVTNQAMVPVKRILPNLHVFNARPIDKYTKNEKGAGVDEVDYSSLNAANKQESQTEKRKDRDSKHLMMAGTKGGIGKPGNSSDSDTNKLKPKKQKPDGNVSNHEVLVQGDEKSDHVKKNSYKHQVLNENDPSNLQKVGDLEKESQKKKQQGELEKAKVKQQGELGDLETWRRNPLHTVDNTKVGKKLEKAKLKQQGELVNTHCDQGGFWTAEVMLNFMLNNCGKTNQEILL